MSSQEETGEIGLLNELLEEEKHENAKTLADSLYVRYFQMYKMVMRHRELYVRAGDDKRLEGADRALIPIISLLETLRNISDGLQIKLLQSNKSA